MKELDVLVNLVKEGEDIKAADLAKEVIDKIKPEDIIKALTIGMRELGVLFENKDIFIPELLIASDALMAVMDIVEPHLLKNDQEKKKKIVIGTVAGDIHEIGKNIVAIVFKAEGFEVVNLGTDVSVRQFIDKAEEIEADIIGLSTLMTTTMEIQREVIEQLKKEGKREKYKIMIGGASVNQKWADKIGADAYCKDAFEGARYINSLVEQG
jgi:dimethylamine corrinoid protein